MEGPLFLPCPFPRLKTLHGLGIENDLTFFFNMNRPWGSDKHEAVKYRNLLQDYSILERSAKRYKDLYEEANSAFCGGIVAAHLKQSSISVEKLEHAIQIYTTLKDYELLKLCRNYCSNILVFSSFNFFNQTIHFANLIDLESFELIDRNLLLQAAVHIKEYLKLVTETKKDKVNVEFIVGLTNLGLTNFLLQNYTKALKYFKDSLTTALALLKCSDSEELLAICMSNLGCCCLEMNRFVEAEEQLQCAISKCEETRLNQLHTFAMVKLSKVQEKLNHRHEAIKTLQKASELSLCQGLPTINSLTKHKLSLIDTRFR